MNHDATHCADWNKQKCPKSCYRARLTEELEERSDLWYLPISYAHFMVEKRICPLCKEENQ